MIELVIDGEKIQVESGTTVLEAARQKGIKIPTFCYHEMLSSPGACRLCIVEIEGMKNLPASCVTQATQGMVIYTHSEKVIEARKTLLELILANHPLDCLTCEKSGDCKLQDYCYEYGVAGSSFNGETHDFELDNTNPYIVRDNNKCILCGKCVRACSEIKGANILDFSERGFHTKVTPAFDTSFAQSECVYCHNCVAVCPVGALMPKELAGKGRHWQMKKEPVTCTFCEAGCEFVIYRKNDRVVGVVAKGAAPGRPLCLKGRLGLNFVHNPDCVEKPLLKVDGEFIPVEWVEALGLGQVFQKLKHVE
jgi:NADP-reducing hydrogenase subunit HndD